MKLTSLVLLAVTTIASCQALTPNRPPAPPAPPLTTVVVMIDTAFSPIEATRIILGIDAWVNVVGPENLAVRYGRIVDPFDQAAPDGTVYVVRKGPSSDLRVPCRGGIYLGCWKAGEHMILIAADSFTHPPDLIRVAGHEFGHAMGLDHHDPPSIMAPTTIEMSKIPQKVDVAAYCKMNLCVKGSRDAVSY